MFVVPDTNQIFGDLQMSGPRWRVLFGQHEVDELQLVIPEVVFREVVKKFRQRLGAALGKANEGLEHLAELGIEVSPIRGIDVALATDVYAGELRERLKAKGVEIPSPGVDVADLLARSLEERRPFQAKDTGLRDALIWHTVLALADKGAVAFVSENSRDFAEKDDREALHSDLVADLRERGLAPDSVQLFASLNRFIDKCIPHAGSDGLQRAQKRLKEDVAWAGQLAERVLEAMAEGDLQPDGLLAALGLLNADLDPLGVADATLGEISIENAYPMESTGLSREIALELLVEADISFNFTTSLDEGRRLANDRRDLITEGFSDTSGVLVTTPFVPVEVGFLAAVDLDTLTIGAIQELTGSAAIVATS